MGERKREALIEHSEFTTLLINAQAGCRASKDRIFHEVSLVQLKALLKHEFNEFLAVAYIAFEKAIEQYKMSEKPKNREHIFWFGSYFKQKVRFEVQQERRLMSGPIVQPSGVHRKVDNRLSYSDLDNFECADLEFFDIKFEHEIEEESE